MSSTININANGWYLISSLTSITIKEAVENYTPDGATYTIYENVYYYDQPWDENVVFTNEDWMITTPDENMDVNTGYWVYIQDLILPITKTIFDSTSSDFVGTNGAYNSTVYTYDGTNTTGPVGGATEQNGSTNKNSPSILVADINNTPSTQHCPQNSGGSSYNNASDKRTVPNPLIANNTNGNLPFDYTKTVSASGIDISNYISLTFSFIGGGGGAGGPGSGTGGKRGAGGGGGGAAGSWNGELKLNTSEDVTFTRIYTIIIGGGGVGGIGGKDKDSGKPGFMAFPGGTSTLTFGIKIKGTEYKYTLNAYGGAGGQGGGSGGNGEVGLGGVGGSNDKTSDSDAPALENNEYWTITYMNPYDGNSGSDGYYKDPTYSSSGGQGGKSPIYNNENILPSKIQYYTWDYNSTTINNNYGEGGTGGDATEGSDAPNSWGGRAGVMKIKGLTFQ